MLLLGEGDFAFASILSRLRSQWKEEKRGEHSISARKENKDMKGRSLTAGTNNSRRLVATAYDSERTVKMKYGDAAAKRTSGLADRFQGVQIADEGTL